jgi:hypothetical protein
MQRQPTGKSILVVALLSAIGAVLGIGPVSGSPVYTSREAAEVAFAEGLSGRVVGFLEGKPFLLETLDTIKDRTQVDLLANSELRVCHYQTSRILVLKGPIRAFISREGVTVENGRAALVFAGTCSAPVTSPLQGGLVLRGVKTVPENSTASKR